MSRAGPRRLELAAYGRIYRGEPAQQVVDELVRQGATPDEAKAIVASQERRMPRLLPGVVLVAIGVALVVGLWFVPLPFPVTRGKTIARLVSFTFALGLIPIAIGATWIASYRARQRALSGAPGGPLPAGLFPALGIGSIVVVFGLATLTQPRGGPDEGDSWTECRDDDGAFQATFPGPPEEKSGGRRAYGVIGKSIFAVTWHDLEGEEWSSDPVARLDL